MKGALLHSLGPSFTLCCCDKKQLPEATWEGVDLPPTTSASKEVRAGAHAGSWRQELKQRPWKKAAPWLFPSFCSASFLLRLGLSPSTGTSVSNEEEAHNPSDVSLG